MQRTITEAKAVLDAMPLTGRQRHKVTKEYDERVNGLLETARDRLKREAASLIERGERHSEEAKELRRELAVLAEQMDRDEVPLDEATARFTEMRDRLARLERVARDLPAAAAAMREQEADPQAHLDDLFRRYPRTAPDWPW